MEIIDLETWPRKTHFEYFERAPYPYIELTVQQDVTALRAHAQSHGRNFFFSLLHGFLKGFNEIEEFRYRIRDDAVVKYEKLDASITVPIEGERFALCQIEYREDAQEFMRAAAAAQEEAKKQKGFVSNENLDVVWVSCNPWFSFTSMSAPTADWKMRSIPLILVGKYYESGGRTLMPLSLKVNHALIDGVHVGKLLAHFERSFSRPEGAKK
jgi:chloramphenicol O-acetyltransferase type A